MLTRLRFLRFQSIRTRLKNFDWWSIAWWGSIAVVCVMMIVFTVGVVKAIHRFEALMLQQPHCACTCRGP